MSNSSLSLSLEIWSWNIQHTWQVEGVKTCLLLLCIHCQRNSLVFQEKLHLPLVLAFASSWFYLHLKKRTFLSDEASLFHGLYLFLAYLASLQVNCPLPLPWMTQRCCFSGFINLITCLHFILFIYPSLHLSFSCCILFLFTWSCAPFTCLCPSCPSPYSYLAIFPLDIKWTRAREGARIEWEFNGGRDRKMIN